MADFSKYDTTDIDDEVDPFVPAPVNWDNLKGAGILTVNECQFLTSLETQSEDKAKEMISKNPRAFAALLLKVAEVKTDSQLQYILKLTEDYLNIVPALAATFYESSVDPISPYMSILHKSDTYILDKAFKVVGFLIGAGDAERTAPHVDAVLSKISENLRSSDHAKISSAVHALGAILRSDQARVAFSRARGVALLVPLVRNKSVQVIYHAIYCIWLLTYSREVAIAMRENHMSAVLHDAIIKIGKEKVTRIALLALKNLLSVGEHCNDMVSIGLPKTLDNLGRKVFGDEDIPAYVEDLSRALEKNIVELSSFDEYRQEVLAGHLERTPAHTSEKFWRENMPKFEATNFQMLKEVANLLNSDENQTVEIAVQDIGQFITYHPRGKKVIQDLGVKTRIMELLAHSDEGVRKAALLTTQKLMVSNWEFMSRS